MTLRLPRFLYYVLAWKPKLPFPQPTLILTERDLVKTVRNSYMSPTFKQLPSLLHDDPATPLDVAYFHLTYNQQVVVDEEE